MNTTMHPLAEDYLRRLDHAARTLPRREREELVSEIRDHLAAGLTPDATEVHVRNVLDELGAPEDIVAAARPEHTPTRRGAREVFALVLLVSGFPPIIGWLAGVGLLLWSPLWNWRQKLVGMLVWPGGYFSLLFLSAMPLLTVYSQSSCVQRTTLGSPERSLVCTGASSPSGPSVWRHVLVVIVVLAPLLVAGYLYRAAGRRAEAV